MESSALTWVKCRGAPVSLQREQPREISEASAEVGHPGRPKKVEQIPSFTWAPSVRLFSSGCSMILTPSQVLYCKANLKRPVLMMGLRHR